ncbi:hypothetical protein E3T54_03010 [Cryobacterium sp. Sr8]|uniref:hypothetical protein n=1 Tax=Cryobacterium sp. Sr8 TaxID=1259203 RepID=UPI00106D7F8C|nr:hypothetical protein [Cryobacterium sp. Sr8]TFD80727.1 hypothetical protein E3T54_03010 [Cryobacterium sp. Sr8]
MRGTREAVQDLMADKGITEAAARAEYEAGVPARWRTGHEVERKSGDPLPTNRANRRKAEKGTR